MAEETPVAPDCASCAAVWERKGATHCWSADPAGAPPPPGACPTRAHADVVQDTLPGYLAGEDAKIARVAATVEGLCYDRPQGGAVHARWTRVEDTIAFAKLMGYRRIGIATCIGLLEESRRLEQILRAQGLEPVSVCCKVGSVDKVAALGIPDAEKVRPGTFEPACNPVAQAEILNAVGTDLNAVVGLCVGHDVLFNKHSKAPVTTLVVKDRVTGHNPVAVLYGQGFYFRRLQKAKLKVPGADEGA
jgi:uncharacterized metal-binding protein